MHICFSHIDLCANISRSIAYFVLSYTHDPSLSDMHTYAPRISHNRTHRQLLAVGMGIIGLHPLVAADRHPRDACYSTNALPRALAMPTNHVEVTEAHHFSCECTRTHILDPANVTTHL